MRSLAKGGFLYPNLTKKRPYSTITSLYDVVLRGCRVNKTAIITDSISCILKEQAEQYNIQIVPVHIFYKGKTYRDWIDLSISQAYQFFEEAPEHWESSAAPPEEYLEIYREASTYAQSILVVTVSSNLSMFYYSAQTAKEIIRDELPHLSIEVLDTKTATAAQGFVALAAAKAAVTGQSFDNIIATAKNVKERVKFLCVLETMRHAYRTGRLPKVLSQVGSILSICPILTSTDKGTIGIHTAARTKASGVEKMLQTMRSQVGHSEPAHVAVMHADCPAEAERLKERIANEFNCEELFITDFSPVMSYATGRGTLALAYYKSF